MLYTNPSRSVLSAMAQTMPKLSVPVRSRTNKLMLCLRFRHDKAVTRQNLVSCTKCLTNISAHWRQASLSLLFQTVWMLSLVPQPDLKSMHSLAKSFRMPTSYTAYLATTSIFSLVAIVRPCGTIVSGVGAQRNGQRSLR